MPSGFDIDRLAELARIRLNDEERKKLGADLEKIIRHVEKLRELNTEKVEPTSHVLNITDVFREDTPISSTVIDDVLKHAPARAGHFFKVPKTVEHR